MAETGAGNKQIVIYGSYGYTGRLISELASKSSLMFYWRAETEISWKNRLKKLGLPFIVAGLDLPDDLDNLLVTLRLLFTVPARFMQPGSRCSMPAFAMAATILILQVKLMFLKRLKLEIKRLKRRELWPCRVLVLMWFQPTAWHFT